MRKISLLLQREAFTTQVLSRRFRFCKQSAFNSRQTSTLLSIMTDLLSYDMRASTVTHNMQLSFQRFQDIVIKHSIERPPKRYRVRCSTILIYSYYPFSFCLLLSVQIFESVDVERIVDYVLSRCVLSHHNFSICVVR